MIVYDLTQQITPEMPVYPGTEQPVIFDACTHEKDHFLEKKLTFYSHTGTHMDAPAHIIPAGKTLDAYEAEWFYGPGLVIDASGTNIKVDDIFVYAERLEKVSFCLIRTGWSQYWGQEQYFENFPVLSPDAARWLAQYPLKGIGIDAISVDAVGSTSFCIHRIFLEKNMVLIENLTNLRAIGKNAFTFSCFPLKIKNADGSPVRAVAIA